jgi:riboflavin kinase/FMN adenylyltransferase
MSTSTENELAAFISARRLASGSAGGAVVAVGVFDGVHAGHAAVIGRLVARAKAKNVSSVVITFKPHPKILLSPQQSVPMLITLAERTRLIRELGVDVVIPLTFMRELADLGARAFLLMLRKYLDARELVMGWNSTLGHDRESPAMLRASAAELGFGVEEVAPVMHGGEAISSGAIRRALAKGEMEKIGAMLRRPFSLEGVVVAGDHMGKELGYPTANLSLEPAQALPADGVYAARARFGGPPGLVKPAAGFIGKRLTFEGSKRVVEVHVLDYAGDLYGKSFGVEILERLRGEEKFSGVEALKAQIAKDIAAIRQKLPLS